ncbi:MAG: hypothetical protein JWO97_4390 [Acidobacteria bacterium]|nr:hypothetical protein [Acidobacteriota bacterium]
MQKISTDPDEWVSARCGGVILKRLLFTSALLLLFAETGSAYDDCRYQMTDRTTISYLDPFDGSEHTQITEYWGWVCENPDIPIVEYPHPPGWNGPPEPPPVQPPPIPAPQPPSNSCSLSLCKADCDESYMLAVAGNGSNTDYIEVKPFHCGVFCVQLATANRDACYGECTAECNNP